MHVHDSISERFQRFQHCKVLPKPRRSPPQCRNSRGGCGRVGRTRWSPGVGTRGGRAGPCFNQNVKITLLIRFRITRHDLYCTLAFSLSVSHTNACKILNLRATRCVTVPYDGLGAHSRAHPMNDVQQGNMCSGPRRPEASHLLSAMRIWARLEPQIASCGSLHAYTLTYRATRVCDSTA